MTALVPTFPTGSSVAAPWAPSDPGIALDPGSQPCYAAAMLDIDSRPMVKLLNDLTMMSALGPPSSDGPCAHRLSRRCTVDFLTRCDEADASFLSDVIRCPSVDSAIGRLVFAVVQGACVYDVHNRRKPGPKTSVSDSMRTAPCGFPVHRDAQAQGHTADPLENAT